MVNVTINHVSFTVSNLQKSIDFYTKVLGLELVNLSDRDEQFSSAITGICGAKMSIAYVKAANCSVELIEYTSSKGVLIDTATNNVGSAHVCFNVKNFDLWIEKLKENGVYFRGDVCFVPAGPNKGRKVVYVTDYDGNNIEFIEEL